MDPEVKPKDCITIEDLDVCIRVLIRHFESLEAMYPNHPLVSAWSINSIRRAIRTAHSTGHLIVFTTGDNLVGFLMYQIGMPWWSGCMVLSELGIYTIDPTYHGFGRIAVSYLLQLAKEYGCRAIEAGGAATVNQKLLYNTYKKFGFNTTYPNFLMSLSHK